MCALRCINYPASDEPRLPEQKGAGEHSDYGSITILKSDPDVPGLEIKLPSGRWAKAPLVEDAFIINIGDMMARWTNDRWVSTLHRVVQPNSADSGASRRQSMAFFHNTSFDAEIECISTCLGAGEQPKYRPVLAGQYLRERFTMAAN
jgi:isopenicillin N synthase-like dioxygenase